MLAERIPRAQEPEPVEESGPPVDILRTLAAPAIYEPNWRLFSSDFRTVTESTYSRSPPMGIP